MQLILAKDFPAIHEPICTLQYFHIHKLIKQELVI